MRTPNALGSSTCYGCSYKRVQEVVVASTDASGNDAFRRLGLTDAELLASDHCGHSVGDR